MNEIQKIQRVVVEIINSNVENANLEIAQADEELTLYGMDSISFIKIVINIEQTFEIVIPDEKLIISEMGTLNKMVGVIVKVLNKDI